MMADFFFYQRNKVDKNQALFCEIYKCTQYFVCRKADNLNQQRSNLEQEKLELETKIRNLDYKLSEESEMRKNAETLLSKTKEQLNKKEEQYTRYIHVVRKIIHFNLHN